MSLRIVIAIVVDCHSITRGYALSISFRPYGAWGKVSRLFLPSFCPYRDIPAPVAYCLLPVAYFPRSNIKTYAIPNAICSTLNPRNQNSSACDIVKQSMMPRSSSP